MTLVRGVALLAATAVFQSCASAGVTPEVEEPARESDEQPEYRTARELVTAMHDRYAGKWYTTLRFQQENTFYTSSGREEKSRWLEHMRVPGRLRIDFLPLSSRSGMIIQNNRVITFDNGRRVESRRSIQPILLLTADIYAIPARVTLRRLDSLGVDLDKLHEDRWDRRRVWVIGADRGNLNRTQVWVDAERLVTVRWIQRAPNGAVTDTRISDWRNVDGYPVPFEFVSVRDGKLFFREQYSNVQVNPRVPAAMFDPARWTSAQPSL